MMANVTVSFNIDTEIDQDILHWLESLPKRGRSQAIREALRGHLGRDVSLSDVYHAVRDLERKIGQGNVILSNGNHREAPDEPEDVAAALDNLGL